MESSFDQVSNVRVRSYAPADREAVRAIALATAMTGAPAALFFEGSEVLADALTIYFTDHEPESCFVAESEGRVVGYIIGAKNVRTMETVFNQQLLWPLVFKVLSMGILLRRKNILFLFQVIRAALSGRFVLPDFSREYSATLHINLLSEARGSGAGGRLMTRYLDYLRDNKVTGVRIATMSEAGGRFFEHHGFKLLYRSSRPYFQHIINKEVPLLIYGRRLP